MELFLIIIIGSIIIYTKANKEIDKYINLRNLNKNKSISNINIFIMAHKDFNNILTNKMYKIVADDQGLLKNKYDLQVIYANKGKLFRKRKSYAEMSKLYYI